MDRRTIRLTMAQALVKWLTVQMTEIDGARVNAVTSEMDSLSGDEARIAFDPAAISVYVDDWRIAPSGAREASA